MNEQKDFQKEYQKGRDSAVTFASLVYSGAVVAATVLFLSFILTAFPETAFLIRALMCLAGLLVGASALAFPVSLHNWAVSGTHRNIATGFYYGEIALIVLNTVVSFSALLFKYAGNDIPAWVQWYEPFTILSLGYVVLAWGTIFITDPQAKAKAKEKAVHDNFIIKVAEDMEEWTKSIEGRKQIQAAALQKITQSFSVKPNEPEHWIKPEQDNMQENARRPVFPVSKYEPWQCQSCHQWNHDHTEARFCSACGAPRELAFSSNGRGKTNFQ